MISMDRADQMRKGRDSAATMKTALSNLRSKIPDVPIVVLEGKDDVPVFEAWIKRASDSFVWEPFVANGKRNSLALRMLLHRDETNLSSKVSFIIDHDYDGLSGQKDGSDIYVLPGYSIENFIATAEALDYFLKGTLQLHSRPELRLEAKKFFLDQLQNYCDLMIQPCARLWAAKNSGVKGVEAKDTVIDNFDFDSRGIFLKSNRNLDDLIIMEGELDELIIEEGKRNFRNGDFNLWIRGKYLFAFFEKCCQVLHRDLTSSTPKVFGASVASKLEVGSTSMSRLASSVQLPAGLKEIVEVWNESGEGGVEA